MKLLLIILLFILFIVVFNVLSVGRLIKRTHNDRFEPQKKSRVSQLFNRKKIDKSKAEDIEFEEIK